MCSGRPIHQLEFSWPQSLRHGPFWLIFSHQLLLEPFLISNQNKPHQMNQHIGSRSLIPWLDEPTKFLMLFNQNAFQQERSQKQIFHIVRVTNALIQFLSADITSQVPKTCVCNFSYISKKCSLPGGHVTARNLRDAFSFGCVSFVVFQIFSIWLQLFDSFRCWYGWTFSNSSM